MTLQVTPRRRRLFLNSRLSLCTVGGERDHDDAQLDVPSEPGVRRARRRQPPVLVVPRDGRRSDDRSGKKKKEEALPYLCDKH